MKKILITGKSSYIGKSFKDWVSKYLNEYKVDNISVRGEEWKKKDFSEYDTVLHLAAIVHVKENSSEKYFKVNRDLTIQLAKKAKEEGVNQFIFLSTMGVYGKETGYIDENTVPNPKTLYAKSKLEAEKTLDKLKDSSFKIAILRPPLVYGKDCGGNYPKLAKMALKLPIFPDIKNERSMIYIDNLSEFIRLVINYGDQGLFFPQNKEYVCTSDMIKLIVQASNKKIRMIKLFNFDIKLFKSKTLNKVFGDLIYEKRLSQYRESYNNCSFITSIKNTEVN